MSKSIDDKTIDKRLIIKTSVVAARTVSVNEALKYALRIIHSEEEEIISEALIELNKLIDDLTVELKLEKSIEDSYISESQDKQLKDLDTRIEIEQSCIASLREELSNLKKESSEQQELQILLQKIEKMQSLSEFELSLSTLETELIKASNENGELKNRLEQHRKVCHLLITSITSLYQQTA